MSRKRTDRSGQSPKLRGRPRGVKSAQRDVVLVRPGACLTCGSTQRTPYRLAFVRTQAGRTLDGALYTHIVYRDTKCEKCGRPRREAHFENRVADVALPLGKAA